MGELIKGVKVMQEVNLDTVLEYSVVEVSTGVKKVVKNQSIQETLDEFWYQVDAIYTGDHEGTLVKVWEDKPKDEEYKITTRDMEMTDLPQSSTNPKHKGNLSGKRVRVTRFNSVDVGFEATLKEIGNSYYLIEDAEIEEYNDSILCIETHPDFGENNIDYYEVVSSN